MAQWRTGSQLGAMPSAPPPDPPSPTLTNPDMILPDFDPMSLSPDITAGRSRGRLIDYSPSRALSSHPVSFMIPSPTAAELDPVVTSMAGSPPYERHGERNEAEYRRSSAGSRDVLPSSPTLPPMYHPGTEHMKPRSPASGTLRDSSYRDSDAHIVDESHDQAQAREAGSSSNFLAMPSRARQNRISGDSISTGGLHSDPDAANMDGDGDKSISSRTPAALSRRAEQILAHAKQSLDNMQGNLNRARHSMIFTHPPDEDSNDLRSVEHPLKTSMSLRSDRSPFKPWTTRYSRPAYHSTSSQISSMDGPPDRQSIRESSKSPVRDSSGSPISAAMYFRPNKSPMPLHLQHSVSARNLETKSEPASAAIGGHPAQQQSFGNGRKASPRSLSRSPPSSGGRDESPGFNQSSSPGPHSSSPGLDELRSQMTELRGRIVSLKQKATEESARRRSVASRKTPSPLNAADEWHYTREHTRSRNTNSPDRLREGVAKQQQQQHGRLDSQAVDRDGVDREDSPVIPIRSRDEIALDSDDEPQLGDDPDEIEQYLLMRENRTKDEFIRLRMEGLYTEQTRLAEQSFRGQYAIYRREGLIRDDDDFDRDGLGGNGSQPFETASAKSAAEGSSHEDRADAFDYENMFLYSSNAKSYPTPPSETSETSDTSERTTRVTSATFAALPTQSPPQIPAQDSSTSRRAPTLRHTPPSGTGRPRKPSNDISQLHVRSSSVCSTSTFQSFATAIEERGTTPAPAPVAVGIGALNDYTQGLRIQTDFRSPGYMTTADGVSIPPLYNHQQQQQQQQRDQLHHSTSAWLDAATPATAGFEGEDDEDEEDDGRGTPTQTNSLNPPEPWTTSVLLRHSAYTESSASPDPSSVIHSRGPLYHSQHPQQHPQHQHHHPHLSPATATAATSGFSGPAALLLRASVASSMMPIMRPGSEAASTPSHSPRTRSLPSLPSSLAQKEGALHRPLLEELPGQLGAARVGAGAGLGAGNGNGAAGLGGGAVRDGGGMGRDVGVGMGTGVVATSTAPVPAEVMRLLVGGLLEGVQTRLAASSPSSSSRPGTAPGPPTTSASTAAHAASNSVSASGANAAERRQSPNGPLQIAAEDQMLLRTLFVRIGATLVGLDGNVGAGAVGVGGVSRNKYRADVVAATAMLK